MEVMQRSCAGASRPAVRGHASFAALVFLVLALLALGCGGTTARAAVATAEASPPCPRPAPAPWIRGVSLAGAEFADARLPGIYGTDYIYPTVESVAYFRAKGMNLVRLPFLWERLQPEKRGPFNADELARLEGFVEAVSATGVLVLLDPHNYARYRGELIGSAAVTNADFADLWTRLAVLFKGNDKVLFGLMNEPHTMPTEQWIAAANAALAAIRSAGAENLVTVPGNAWSGAHSWSKDWYGTPNATAMKDIVDPGHRMFIEVHQYLDDDSSASSATCVSATIGSERLRGFTDWLRRNNQRALLGEFAGAANATCEAALADMLRYVAANADVWAGWVWWAAGPWWGPDMFSIEPEGRVDMPQMKVLEPFLR